MTLSPLALWLCPPQASDFFLVGREAVVPPGERVDIHLVRERGRAPDVSARRAAQVRAPYRVPDSGEPGGRILAASRGEDACMLHRESPRRTFLFYMSMSVYMYMSQNMHMSQRDPRCITTRKKKPYTRLPACLIVAYGPLARERLCLGVPLGGC